MFGVRTTTIRATSVMVADGTWHSVVVSRAMNTGLMTIQVDGTLEASGTGVTSSLTSPAFLDVGAHMGQPTYLPGGANHFIGELRRIAVLDSI